jgi:hypothetical protein
MFQNLLKSIAAGAFRHLVTGLGAILVSNGYLDQSDTAQFIGSAMFFFGIAWSAYQKFKAHNDLTGNTVQTVPVQTPPLPPIK